MRMRFKPYAREELMQSKFYVSIPQTFKNAWQGCFSNKENQLYLELGCGKGGFAASLAASRQDINLIAIDITDKVLVLAKRNIEAEFDKRKISNINVKIMSFNIERLPDMLGSNDKVSRIYINFCNPWDKKSGQTKHRLTHTRQLLNYKELLKSDGEIYFKCDHEPLFKATLRYLSEAGFIIKWITYNLHENEPDWNIRTEHEQMFSSAGIPIKALIAVKE